MKVGVLGCGGMGRGVARTLQNCDGVTGVVGYDISAQALAQAADNPGIATTDDLPALLADPDLRLVFVTASNAAHKPLTLAALQAGKAVLCEKPIATTIEDAREIVDTAERLGAFLQIGFELRYSLLYVQIKKWVDAGLLGDIVNTQCTYLCSEFHGKGSWRNAKATGGSMFGEKLCHYVDLPRWWIGAPVTEVYSVCAPNVIPYYEVRDNYHTVYRFANGAVSELTFVMYLGQTFAGDPLQNVISQQQGDGHALRYLILGTKGAAETDVFNRSLKRWEFGDSPKCLTSTLVEELSWDPKQDGRYFHDCGTQTRDIVRRVLAGEPPMTPARDAFETMRLVFAAEQSADQGVPIRL